MEGLPYYVWDCARNRPKKRIQASDRENLIKKGCAALGIKHEEFSQLVCEADGTKVNDQSYFKYLEANSEFVILREGEKWQKIVMTKEKSHPNEHHKRTKTDINTVAERMKEVPNSFNEFDSDKLEVIVNCSSKDLAHRLGKSEIEASLIQEECQDLLDKKDSEEEQREIREMFNLPTTTSSSVQATDEGAQNVKSLNPTKSYVMSVSSTIKPPEREMSKCSSTMKGKSRREEDKVTDKIVMGKSPLTGLSSDGSSVEDTEDCGEETGARSTPIKRRSPRSSPIKSREETGARSTPIKSRKLTATISRTATKKLLSKISLTQEHEIDIYEVEERPRTRSLVSTADRSSIGF